MASRFVATTMAGIKAIVGDFKKLPPEVQDNEMSKSTTVGDYLETPKLKTLSITEALDRFKEMPMLYELILDLYEEDYDEVEMGVDETGKMVCRGIEKGNPTSAQVHVPSTDWEYEKETPIIFKAEESEKRYTFAPWYVPDSIDAHDEWADKDEVQIAFWDYLKNGDRNIRLQHNKDIVAGEWVEGATWPYPVTLPVRTIDGDKEITFPAGTPFLGVIWEPWAWQMIKNGEITGLSIGGRGKRKEGDPSAEVTASYGGDAEFAKMIVQEGGLYVVYDDAKTRSFGSYETKEEAEDRLAQIERFSKREKLEVGDFVSWNSSGGRARGRVERIVSNGEIDVPDTSFTISGEEDNPAVLISIWRQGKDGWEKTDTLVGHKRSTLRTISPLNKESFTPPKGVQEEAQRALRWMEEGEAGSNFTSVGRRRASQLGNGQAVSLDTMRRMRSFLARHEDSSKGAEGFKPGDDGYPSAGRVAWAAWGGDPAKSWVESVLSRYDEE